MRYILRFSKHKEVEVEGFVPMVGDFINIKSEGAWVELKVERRDFVIGDTTSYCLCHCSLVRITD